MKKTAIYSLLALGAFVASCDEVEKMTGEPTVYPQLPGYEISELNLSSPIGSAVDLPALNAADADLAVLSVGGEGNLPEGYKMHFTYEVSSDKDFTVSQTLPVTLNQEGTTGYVTVHSMEKAFEEFFGLIDTPETMYGRALAYAQNESNNVVRLGDYFANAEFSLTPDPIFVLYTPGNSNSWNQANSQQIKYKDGKYVGFAYLNGEFKFTNQPNWDGVNFGDNGEAEPVVTDGVMTITGQLTTDGSAGNLHAPEAALYYIEVNTENLTYQLVKINGWAMIGDFNGWGSDEALTPSSDFLTWTGTLTLAEAGGWKFRANNGWGINLGGKLTDLTFGGDNINSEAGTYEVTLDFTQLPYTAKVVKK